MQLDNILKIVIIPGPQPPKDMDEVVEYIMLLIDRINNAGDVPLTIKSDSELEPPKTVYVIIIPACSVYDFPGMAKFTKLPAGLKANGCFICDVAGYSRFQRMIYTPDEIGKIRTYESLEAAIAENEQHADVKYDTLGIRAKKMPEIFVHTRFGSVHMDVMHADLNWFKKVFSLAHGARLKALNSKKAEVNETEDVAECKIAMKEQYEAFCLKQHELDFCDNVYRNKIIPSEGIDYNFFFIIVFRSVPTRKGTFQE